MKQLLVFGDKTFRITVPDDAKITYGPFSPPTKDGYGQHPDRLCGTLRIYQGNKDNIIACFAGVKGFRDMTMPYAEEVAKEEGAVIWKTDDKGYQREEKAVRTTDWLDPVPTIAAPKAKAPRK